jgi:hypothetical protein
MKKKTFVLAALLSLSMLLSACGKTSDATDTAPSTEPTPTATATPTPTPEPEYFNALTGEKIEDDSLNQQRPYAAMINNISVAQPQCGISQADIIYEVLAEGGITRMMGIFSDISSVEKLGSMRSIRPYYIDIGLSYDAIIVHAGGSDDAYAELNTGTIDHIDGVRGGTAESEAFYRDPDRMSAGYEHSLFTSGQAILSCTQELGFRTEHEGTETGYGLNFDEAAKPVEGLPANAFTVNFLSFKTTDFTYDSASGLYHATQYGSDYADGNDDSVLGFKNVLVLFADTSTYDSYGRLTINLEGSGTGYFMCGGTADTITWSHSGTGEPFTYKDSAGEDLTLGVGKTYICIVPTDSPVDFNS